MWLKHFLHFTWDLLPYFVTSTGSGNKIYIYKFTVFTRLVSITLSHLYWHNHILVIFLELHKNKNPVVTNTIANTYRPCT